MIILLNADRYIKGCFEKSNLMYYANELFNSCFKIRNYISNGIEVMKILIINNNIKSFFAKINQIGKLKRVDTKIAYKLCAGLYVIGINTKLFHEELLYILKHTKPPCSV